MQSSAASSSAPQTASAGTRRPLPGSWLGLWQTLGLLGGLALVTSFFMSVHALEFYGWTRQPATTPVHLVINLREFLGTAGTSFPGGYSVTLVYLLITLVLPHLWGVVMAVSCAAGLLGGNAVVRALRIGTMVILLILIPTGLVVLGYLLPRFGLAVPGSRQALELAGLGMGIVLALLTLTAAVLVPVRSRNWADTHLTYQVSVFTTLIMGTLIAIFVRVPGGGWITIAGLMLLTASSVGQANAVWGTSWGRTLSCLLKVKTPSELLERGICPACGYSLAGLPEMRCPECGRPFTTADLQG